MNTEQHEEKKTKPSGCGCMWLLLILLLVVGGGAFAWWKGYIPQTWLPPFLKAKQSEAAQADGGKGGAGGGGKRGGKRGGGPVPVMVAKAKKGDLPIYLNALGTATALNTVTIHTRVDGALDKVLYTEGEHVKQGDLLVQIDPRPFQAQLEVAQGQLAKDQASLVFSKSDLQRYQEAGQSVTKQQLDNATAVVGQFEGAVKTDQANVDTAQLQITYSNITSPVTGRVGLRLVDAGNIVHAADATGLVVITQVSPITVVFSLPESFLPQIFKGGTGGIQLPVEAYDGDNKIKLATGSLLAVDSQIDPTTGTIRCRASFENKDEIMFPNQFVNVRLLVDTRKDVVLVPLAALQHSPKTDFVYIVKDDKTVEMRPVKAGTSEGEQLIVESGLTPGETVVTEGVDKLQPGAKITMPDAKDAAAGTGKGKGSGKGSGQHQGGSHNSSGSDQKKPEKPSTDSPSPAPAQ